MGIAENKKNIQQTAALSFQCYWLLMYGISLRFHVLFTLLCLLNEFKWEKCIKKKQILLALNMSHSLSLLVLLCKAWTCVCVCVCVCACVCACHHCVVVAEQREWTAGRPTLDYVLTCFAFTCYSAEPNVSTRLCCSWASINLTARARQARLK